MPPSRRSAFLCSAAVAAAILIALAFSFSPFVRSKANSQAARLGALLSIRAVRPALLGARLLDLDLSFPDIPAASVHFDEIFVTASGSVSVRGGLILLRADQKTLADQVSRWRASRPPIQGSSAKSRVVTLQGLQLTWTGLAGEGSSLQAGGLQSEDVLNSNAVAASDVRFVLPRGELTAQGVQLALSRGSEVLVTKLLASSLKASVQLPEPTHPKAEPAAASSSLPKAPSPAPSASAAPQVPSTPVPALRDRLSHAASAAAMHVAPDVEIRIDAFELHAKRGEDAVTLGPGRLAAGRKEGNVVIDLSPGASAQPSPAALTLRASIPTAEGAVILDVNGGPIQLSVLGLHEGDLGLIHTDKASVVVNAHVELTEDGRGVVFNGNVKSTGISVKHDKLADGPVEGLAVAGKLKGFALLDGTQVKLEDSEIDVGSLQLTVDGSFERDAAKRIRVDGRFGIPMVACQDALDSLPATLVPVVHGMRLAGTLSLTGRLRFDPSRPQDFLFDYRGQSDCRFLSVPSQVDVQRFRTVFKRTVYGPDNQPVDVQSGPGSPGWVPFGGISQNMEAAVMTTEDGRFRIHHGFDHEAIHNALKDNLMKGAFVRGASTITMQLSKNLYLERKKTLSRKLQELILTMYLEQVLTKEQILELYFNVVEFGPMIYGIGPAAAHYFRCSPTELTPGQAMFLSSILPQPKLPRFGAGGKLNEGWMRYLFKLIKIAGKRGWITPEDSEIAQQEWVVFGGPPVRTEGAAGPATSGEAPPPEPPED
jgi:hypothetical protein